MECARNAPRLDPVGRGVGFVPFWRGVFSDGGTPSSSRVDTCWLAIAVTFILFGVFRQVCAITDPALLRQWPGSLPLIIAALVGLIIAPYTVNRVSGSITSIVSG